MADHHRAIERIPMYLSEINKQLEAINVSLRDIVARLNKGGF